MAPRSHFDKWVGRKDGFERGRKLLFELDDRRINDGEKFRGVTVSLAAIERSLEGDDSDEDDGDADVRRVTAVTNTQGPFVVGTASLRVRGGSKGERDPALDGSKGLAKTMYDVWKKWTMESHVAPVVFGPEVGNDRRIPAGLPRGRLQGLGSGREVLGPGGGRSGLSRQRRPPGLCAFEALLPASPRCPLGVYRRARVAGRGGDAVAGADRRRGQR